jgi:hypothetical protein
MKPQHASPMGRTTGRRRAASLTAIAALAAAPAGLAVALVPAPAAAQVSAVVTVGVDPLNLSKGVAADANVVVTLDGLLNAGLLQGQLADGTVRLRLLDEDGRVVQGISTVEILDGNTARVVLNPASPLEGGSNYTVDVFSPLLGIDAASVFTTAGTPTATTGLGDVPPGARCADVRSSSARPSRTGGKFSLSRQQLQINQRISQAAVRRSNAIQAWLDAKIAARDLCGGGLVAPDFGEGVVTRQGADATPKPVASPRPLTTAAKRGSGGTVRLSAGQLLINQRISQAAVRRSNALLARLRAGLTGGDLRDGVVTRGHLVQGLDVAEATPAARPPGPSTTRVARGRGSGDAVTLSVAQLRINQRISQAAVRRANLLRDTLRRGLTGANFRDGTITAVKLSAELRSGS